VNAHFLQTTAPIFTHSDVSKVQSCTQQTEAHRPETSLQSLISIKSDPVIYDWPEVGWVKEEINKGIKIQNVVRFPITVPDVP